MPAHEAGQVTERAVEEKVPVQLGETGLHFSGRQRVVIENERGLVVSLQMPDCAIIFRNSASLASADSRSRGARSRQQLRRSRQLFSRKT